MESFYASQKIWMRAKFARAAGKKISAICLFYRSTPQTLPDKLLTHNVIFLICSKIREINDLGKKHEKNFLPQSLQSNYVHSVY